MIRGEKELGRAQARASERHLRVMMAASAAVDHPGLDGAGDPRLLFEEAEKIEGVLRALETAIRAHWALEEAEGNARAIAREDFREAPEVPSEYYSDVVAAEKAATLAYEKVFGPFV